LLVNDVEENEIDGGILSSTPGFRKSPDGR
jgi:hypothetical protein